MRSDFWRPEKDVIDEHTGQIADEWNKEVRALAVPIPGGDSATFNSFTHLLTQDSSRIRGFLAQFSYKAFGGENEEAGLDTATAIEAIQTGLLILDDIEDNSRLRRGVPTVHNSLSNPPPTELGTSVEDKLAFGRAQAINVAFTGMQFANRLIQDLRGVDPPLLVAALGVMSQNLIRTGLGEMADVAAPYHAIDESTALAIARAKTAHYTFAMPMRVGATLAGASEEAQSFVAPFSKSTGALFQIQDDLVGVLSGSAAYGKEANDLSEGKQTIPIIHASNLATPAQRKIIEAARTDHRQMPAAQAIIAELALGHCQALIADYSDQAHAALSGSDSLPPSYSQRLHGFIDHLAKPAEF